MMPATCLPRSPLQKPERCPHCNSTRVEPKGKRTKKLEQIPLYRCGGCGRNFTPGPRAFRNKTYPIQEILEAISTYNRGYSLEETADKISSRHGHTVHPSTISRWLSQHPSLTTYRRLRDEGRKRFHPSRVMPTTKLYHAQVYEYALHRAKLAALRDGSLGGSPSLLKRFEPLADFLENVGATCPHELFRAENGLRGSRLSANFLALDNMIVMERTNTATETAALIVPSVGGNHERHPRLQRFMLANDSSTLAIEVPIWLNAADIAALERRYGVSIVPRDATLAANQHITGHIDFIQVRNDAIHLLDYKPDARTNRPIAQLTIYAMALMHLIPGLRLFDIKCAWFNEHCYNEFFPRKLLPARG